LYVRQGVQAVEKRSRREQYSEETRAALLESARSLFAERGFADTSIEDVVSRAGMTRGALYHHFASKRDLFEAVFEDLERELMERVAGAGTGEVDVWKRTMASLYSFLDGCLEPTCRRIALQEAPTVLGRNRWREIDERYAMGLVRAGVEELIDTGVIAPQPVDLLAHVLFGALTEAAFRVAAATDPAAARDEAAALLERMVGSLRVDR
jgi:AcrR family transcriptional regulator